MEQKVGKEERSWKRSTHVRQINGEFSEKSKLNAAECVNSPENKSEHCQPIILKDGKEVDELYHNDNFLENIVQTSVAICGEKDADDIFEFVQQDKLLVGIGGND